MRKVSGPDFDSGQEFEEVWKAAHTRAQQHAFASAINLLADALGGGFQRIRRLCRKTGVDRIWIFEEGELRMAFEVPGDGLAQTRDTVLLVTWFATAPRDEAALMAEASRRQKIGRKEKWD